MVLAVEWGAGLLEFWVDLGEEMGEVCWVLDAGFRWKGRRRKVAIFLQGRGGELGGSRGALMLSLSGRQKAVKEEWR